MSDLQSEIGAGGRNGTEQVDLFRDQGEAVRESNGRNGNGKHGRNGSAKPSYGNGLAAPSDIGKNFVLDTNVLLHDPDCIAQFADNHICIPLEVLCELDRFKNEQTERGANARAAHRRLAALFSPHPDQATQGVSTSGGGSVRLVPARPLNQRKQSVVDEMADILRDGENADNRILLCTRLVDEENAAPTALVTKDLNLQLKAHALGLRCEDYQSDKVDHTRLGEKRPRAIDLKPSDLQRFASTGTFVIPASWRRRLDLNEYVLLQAGEKRTMPARADADGQFHKLRIPDMIRIQKGAPLRPLNLGQQCFLDALLNPEISLVTCYGQAGTGKTLLAVASALHSTFAGDYNGVTVSRPVIPLGDTLGFLPGTLEEKLDPWLKPIFDALEFILTPNRSPKKKKTARSRKPGPQDNSPVSTGRRVYDNLIESGLIEVEALCYIRGRSIPNRFFILDEAQQLTPLEAKTIVTRMAQGSKLVLVGDPGQIDNPYVDRLSNGLVHTRDRLRDEPFSAHVTLARGERSDLAEAGAKKM